ncbi:alpha/beta hydrolase [Herbiconiux flava]|uniref:Pimeloyl-ACP methyl ester carboxylesterase n=1 Tax=Herbiconiux flava TaxID=881268 RepID=A0A852SJ17_9MICO|nr:alpha/beta hydrolase [Herbiconiux flava]NYD69263.1 pimeloyl-ACP methyl ester carboxylesterase [Herbiconiux flava]GLK16009.1 alpha/beta hydrolase [Herbiconiux flava]
MDLIFVHGALVRDGEWWWRPTAGLLEERTGIRSRALALPSCGEVPDDARGLVADAAALRRALDDVEHAVVVGHSYGGTVIAEAGRHPAIAHLVLISSYLPEVGTTQAAILADEPDPAAIADGGDGTLTLSGYDEAAFGARFLQDGDRGLRRDAFARITSQHAESFVTPTTGAGWQGVDSTYLVCADDRSTTPALQRAHAARATRTLELPTGHHPFLTRPDLVVDAVEALPLSGVPGV